ncbi:MAG: hypothetical protein ACRCZF_22190, partial [Gemmataceae bacterium]
MMNSTLKIFLIIGLLMAVVFGATVISEFSFTPPKKVDDSDPSVEPLGPPLDFPMAKMIYDPSEEAEIAHRGFSGFIEVSDREHHVGFWFRNVRTKPIELAAVGRSCTKCTSAKVALVKKEQFTEYASQLLPLGFPGGGLPVPDLISAIAAAKFAQGLTWQPFDFDDSSKRFMIPAAPSQEESTQGLIAMGFTAKVADSP